MRIVKSLLIFILIFSGCASGGQGENKGWYTEGNFKPVSRIKITLVNKLDFDRINCPVVIRREQLPIKDIHEMCVTVVDPSLESNPKPTKEMLSKQGSHLIRKETNGHQIFRQLDDLDGDGIWDELFFMTNIKAGQSKTMYLYGGFSQRGWNEHGTHAAIGSYCRHLVPFWESKHVGWKLWYPTDCDFYCKRKGALMSPELYMKNLDGYGVAYEHGSDTMRVAESFGAGGICLFEDVACPNSVSRPRFTPAKAKTPWNEGSEKFNRGPLSDTRYAYEVVVNGPVRSMVRIKTMNWKSGAGVYELEQLYTAYSDQNYSTCKVRYLKFEPEKAGTKFGCGIRKNARENDFYQKDGVVITIGDDELSDPDDKEGLRKLYVSFVGTAMVVKEQFKPEYQFVDSYLGNHTFRIPVRKNISYEYLIAGAWSEGSFLSSPEEFKDYVIKTAKEYNNPIEIRDFKIETKESN